MDRHLPRSVDTVIVGNGPSALILSYILHGNIPCYDTSNPHPDPILHAKLRTTHDLLHIDVEYLTEHFSASRFSYSTQALPINVLLDTLIRPLGETDDTDQRTCVQWRHEPTKTVSHIVVGNTPLTGGQWVDNPVKASWDIGTLSYGGMLSLPGYSFAEHYERTHGTPIGPFQRPTRRAVTDYFAAYPAFVGIEDAMYCGQTLSGITRRKQGFYISSHGITCKHLVLASGTFSEMIPARPLLQPLFNLPDVEKRPTPDPLLVVGSGFSAADVIISAPPSQKIIHIFKWAPSTTPSPLRACNHDVYPEYVSVYRHMKFAALSSQSSKDPRPKLKREMSAMFDLGRNWGTSYEGLPNTAITDVRLDGEAAVVTLQHRNDIPFERRIGGVAYVVGRRGSLNYLDPSLRAAVCGKEDTSMISGQTLREKANEDLEVARNVFITGSLTGDSLIRFAYGGCTYAAGKIMASLHITQPDADDSGCECSDVTSKTASPYVRAMNGLEGHHLTLSSSDESTLVEVTLDRRKDEDEIASKGLVG